MYLSDIVVNFAKTDSCQLCKSLNSGIIKWHYLISWMLLDVNVRFPFHFVSI